MKRLWKYIPPCFSDVQGFQMAVSVTDGMGIVDDPSKYKPFPIGGEGGKGGKGGRGGRDGEHIGSRVIHSDIRNADIITGTGARVLEAFRSGADKLHPAYVLLGNAPSSSMIGSDLWEAADRITSDYGIPAAPVKIDGSRDYLYGISVTLEAMGRLLLEEPSEIIPRSVNILGANAIDWTGEEIEDLKLWLLSEGMTPLTLWGMRDTAANLRRASCASVNLVVNEAGLRLAAYMEEAYGTPFVVGAPFGRDRIRKLFEAPRRGKLPSGARAIHAPSDPEVLLIGEQLRVGAVRDALGERGFTRIRVLSFLDMDKSLMREGDRKLTGEDDLLAELAAPSLRLVMGDPDLRPLYAVSGSGARFIELPNPGSQYPVEIRKRINFCGEKLEDFLNDCLL